MSFGIVAAVGGGLVLGSMMGGSGQPDTGGMNQAAVDNAQVAADTLAWYKEKDALNRPMQDKLANVAYDVAQQQLTSSKANDALAADYADYNKTTFRPLEQGLVADAEGYDTPAKRQAAADSAVADVDMQFARSNEAAARAMAANGINPGSARAMSVLEGQGVDRALGSASAAYNARKGIETVGYARKMDAASLGRGLASSQATSAQVALTAGNNAVSNTGAPITSMNQSTQTNGQGFNTAISGNNSAGNLYGQIAGIQNQADANSNAWMGAAGQAAGAYFGMKSDVNMKTDIEPVNPDQALNEIVSTPVSKWKYDPAKMAQEGIPIPEDSKGENTGPMAQDVNAAMGEEAAPGGTEINLISMNGKAMAAIQSLDKKINRLAKLVEQGVSA
jgi:hypothetical protein